MQSFLKFQKESLKKIPQTPGVYIFWKNNSSPLYVGKAINLRSRINSYFSKTLLPKTEKMISETTLVSFIKVTSELEALLLEAVMVKKLATKYNILLKDDKHPLYIKITKDVYPRILTARKIDNTNENRAFFGPYPSSLQVRRVLTLLRQIFPYATHKTTKRACLESQINLCSPCPSEIEAVEDYEKKQNLKYAYMENIYSIEKILSGRLSTLRNQLVHKMQILAAKEKFEEASYTKEKIDSLDYITQPINQPSSYLANPNLEEDLRTRETKHLKQILDNFLKVERLSRIECFDVSHHAGRETSAAMTTFINGQIEKNLFRLFKVKSVKGANDVASMEEVAIRRLKHLKDWGKPNLVIVDGGKGQVAAFYKHFSSADIPVVGLEKRFETLVIPQVSYSKVTYKKVRLQKGEARNLVQKIRDETHRFAVSYHHRLAKKSLQLV